MIDDRIQQLLADIRLLDEGRFQLVQSLRETVLGLAVGVAEEVKYGGILFSAPRPFCGLFSYARHVSLEFGAGASLPDIHGVLEGQGKFRRHIKLFSLEEVSAKQVKTYLHMALDVSGKV